MLLTDSEVELFFKLHRELLFYVNGKLGIVPDVTDSDEYSALPVETRYEVHKALLEHRELIEQFVVENPAGFDADELDIVLSWRHLVAGRFFVFRQLMKYAVFLTDEEPATAYGVTALFDPFEVVIPYDLPCWVGTVLLPFRDKIVYDGIMHTYNISFGPGIRRSLNDSYKEAKARQGIVTTLSPADKPAPKRKTSAAKTRKRKTAVKEQVRPFVDAITGLTDDFCRKHLNEEYAEFCRKLTEKLARKRPSPLFSGSVTVWAAGIVRTIGWVNFLHDSNQTPHMRLLDIDAAFGIAESTGAAKLKAIRTMLRIQQCEPEWTLTSRLDDNPLVWMLQVDGFVTDIRRCPREAQEVAFQKGLIPWIPADRAS